MARKHCIWQTQHQPPAVRLVGQSLWESVEPIVSAYIGQNWFVREARDVSELASHPAAILSDGVYPVFIKFSDAADALESFKAELKGLQTLSCCAGVLVPDPIGVFPLASGFILVLEAVRAIERTPLEWRQIGRMLARIHQSKADRFGLDEISYFGPLRQDNSSVYDWPTFYAERRLLPALRLAVDSGNIPARLVRQMEELIAHLPGLCGPRMEPTLLHGDAQQNNFVSTEQGAYVIDPAVYYGHPEMDLACLDFFQPVPEDVFDGYRELMPILPGFWERRDLWRLWGHLACVAVAGSAYLDGLSRAVTRYI